MWKKVEYSGINGWWMSKNNHISGSFSLFQMIVQGVIQGSSKVLEKNG